MKGREGGEGGFWICLGIAPALKWDRYPDAAHNKPPSPQTVTLP